MITIAVDAMGGDHAPRPEVEGSVLAAREMGVRVLLVGQQSVVRAELAKHASPNLPIEIVPFGAAAIRRAVEAVAVDCGCPGPALIRNKQDGHAFVTDGGHWLLDAKLQRIGDPQALAARLCAVPGVVEHGLFIGLAGTAILGGPDGVRLVERP